MSERNRRKRLNNQLFTLRGLVPCITKMDKRSVLVDALAYLQDILNQTQKEIEAGVTEDPGHAIIDSAAMSPDSLTENVEIDHPPCHHLGVVLEKSVINADVEGQPQPIMSTALEPKTTPYSAVFPAITKMEAEKVDEEIYMLKIVYNKALGAMSQVQRSVEMLKGFDFINVSVSEYDQHHMQSSSFLRVKKIKGSLLVTDEENLIERVKVMAKQLGLNLPSADD
ncbi:transcription factor bHLH27-like [Papaver somniferum]|uniref:transcription factor bHLH27-like n=1 Tax=Papaver somniferum TaxID=3469 RepID=UPI000E6F610F|nr:transcription factor bHLH27-like [Papaver somniferum]